MYFNTMVQLFSRCASVLLGDVAFIYGDMGCGFIAPQTHPVTVPKKVKLAKASPYQEYLIQRLAHMTICGQPYEVRSDDGDETLSIARDTGRHSRRLTITITTREFVCATSGGGNLYEYTMRTYTLSRRRSSIVFDEKIWRRQTGTTKCIAVYQDRQDTTNHLTHHELERLELALTWTGAVSVVAW